MQTQSLVHMDGPAARHVNAARCDWRGLEVKGVATVRVGE